MKTLTDMRENAREKRDTWQTLSRLQTVLADRGISEQQAQRNFAYWSGQYDGLCEALGLPAGRRF